MGTYMIGDSITSDYMCGDQNGKKDNQDENNEQDDTNTHPFALVSLMSPGNLQLPSAPLYKGRCLVHLLLDVVQLLSLSFNQHCHIHKDLMQLQQILLNILHCIMTIMDFSNRLCNLSSTLNLDGFL